eukprot:220931-Hanusia_phi.AAC.1
MSKSNGRATSFTSTVPREKTSLKAAETLSMSVTSQQIEVAVPPRMPSVKIGKKGRSRGRGRG